VQSLMIFLGFAVSHLGTGRLKDLQSWRTSDGTDFASRVQHDAKVQRIGR